jgi:hypothetical protein
MGWLHFKLKSRLQGLTAYLATSYSPAVLTFLLMLPLTAKAQLDTMKP